MLRVIVIALLCAAGAAAGDCPPSVVRVVREGVQPGFDRRDDGGSGVVVRAGKGRSLVVTNRHVLDASKGEVFVYSVTGWWGPAKIVRFAAGADLAVLEVDRELPAAPLAAADAPPGTPVTLYGYPHGVRRTRVKAGRVEGIDQGSLKGTAVMTTTVVCEDGDSGAGHFDAKGRLTGLTFTRTWVVPASEIRKVLDELTARR